MEMIGEQRIPVGQDVVWRALNDPEVIKAAVPGCESIVATGENQYELTVLAAVGPVRARFKGNMRLVDLKPPVSYNLVFEGAGGVAGFAKGDASVELEAAGAETILRYRAKAQVGGKLAQIGSRMIDATARKMADQFFSNFVAVVAPSAAPHGGAVAVAARGPLGLPAWLWGDIAVLLIVTAGYFALR